MLRGKNGFSRFQVIRRWSRYSISSGVSGPAGRVCNASPATGRPGHGRQCPGPSSSWPPLRPGIISYGSLTGSQLSFVWWWCQGASKAPSRHRRPAIDGPGWAPPCELVLVSLPSPHPPWHKRIVLCRGMFANHAAKLSVSGKQRPAFPEISKTVSLLSCRKACGIVPVSWLWLR